jgi:filamentous hemagglutinin family protein
MKYNTGANHRHSTITRDLRVRRKAAALAVAACFSTAVWANPTNPVVVHGTASFAQAGNVLNVTNSHNAIINWGSFSIGVNELTRFIQPSALSAVLNRVTGQDPSAILGALQSNGRVFLLNPNGIVFGAGAQIDVAGLVASTLNLSNADFLAGRMNFTGGAGAGSLVNQGAINATGGPVYLVGSAVTNQGIITNPGGEIVLAAGNSVELVNPGTPNLRVEIQANDHEAKNLGSLVADAGRIGIYAGLIRQGGVINADSAVAEGGRIMLRASRNITLEPGSLISAKGVGGGNIVVLADDTTQVAGALDASAPNGGNGGFIETSGKIRVQVDPGTQVTTSAGHGQTGVWLVDPNDLVIAAYGGDITGASIAGNLGSTNVVLTSDDGGMAGAGDILVNDAIAWNSGNSLTLTARRNVNVNSTISNTGSGDIHLNAGWDGLSPASSPLVGGTGGITVNAPLTTGGAIELKSADGGILVNAALTAGGGAGLDVVSTTGNIAFTASGSVNSSGTLNLIGPNMDLASAAFLSAGNINIEGYRGEFLGNVRLGDSLPGELGLTQADLNKLQLHFPATGKLTIRGHDISLAGQTAFNPAKVSSLFLNAQNGISQSSGASLAVQKLRADGAEGVFLDGETNAVSVLSGRSLYAAFRFRNTGALEIGTVAGLAGVNSSANYSAEVAIQNVSGNLTVNAPVSSIAGSDSSSASVTLSADNDGLIVNNPVSASTDGMASVYLNSSSVQTINAAVSASGGKDALIGLSSGGPIAINSGGSLSAVANTVCCYYGTATVNVGSTNAGIIMNSGASILADGGEGNAEVDLRGDQGFVLLNAGSSITALTDGLYGGEAEIRVTSAGGRGLAGITQNASITADGGERGFIQLATSNAIEQTDVGGFLKAMDYGGSNSFVQLTAESGIGDRDSPIRIDMAGAPDVGAFNIGDTGHIGLSFFNTSALMPYHTGSGLQIDYLGYIRNINPAGTYYLRSDTNIELVVPFMPGNIALLPGQTVVLDAPNGQIYIGQLWVDGPEGFIPTGVYGSIRAGDGGAGNVELLSGGKLTIESDSFVTGYEPLIRVGDIDLQGAIRSAGGFINIRHAVDGPIHLGIIGDGAGGALALDNAELGRMSSWSGVDNPLDPGSGGGLVIGDIGGGPLIFKEPVNPTPAFLNVRGSSVTQEVGAYIVGGINAYAGNMVSLNDAGNMIDYVTGGTFSGGTFVATSSASMMRTGTIQTGGGNITLTAPSVTIGGTLTSPGGAVTVTAINAIVDDNPGVDIVAAQALLTGPLGVGSIANPIETAVASLTVNSEASAGQEVGIINSGNLTLSGLNFRGILAAIGTTGTLTTGASLSSWSGGVSLSGNTGLVVNRPIYGPQLSLNSGSGTLLVDGVPVSASIVDLTGNTISVINGATVVGFAGLSVNAAGNLNVSDSILFGYNNLFVNAGGNVSVTGGTIDGSPDVFMTVGGQVFINGTAEMPGRISSGSPDTINLNFLNLTSGGFTINGVSGIYHDPATGSGFFANGLPASPGSGLNITYGGTGMITVDTSLPTNTLIVSLNQSTKAPEAQQSTGALNEEEDSKKTAKKDAPVCR